MHQPRGGVFHIFVFDIDVNYRGMHPKGTGEERDFMQDRSGGSLCYDDAPIGQYLDRSIAYLCLYVSQGGILGLKMESCIR